MVKVYKLLLFPILCFLFFFYNFTIANANCNGHVICENADGYGDCQPGYVGGWYTKPCNYDSYNACTGVCNDPKCLVSEACSITYGTPAPTAPPAPCTYSCQSTGCSESQIGGTCTPSCSAGQFCCGDYSLCYTPPAPSCTITLSPASLTATQQSTPFTASINYSNGALDSANFSSSNTSVAVVNPPTTVLGYQLS